MYYCALSLGVLQDVLPRFLVTCAFWCVLEYSFRELSLKKILCRYMVLRRTSYMYGGFFEYYFRLQFSAFWSMHDTTSSWENVNFKMYPEFPPPQKKTWITSIKKVNPPATTWKISNTLTRNSSHWDYLNSMRNLKLLEKYQPPPP